MDSTKPIQRAGVGPAGADYGAIVRRLGILCQQVDAFTTPLPTPSTQSPSHFGSTTAEGQNHRSNVAANTEAAAAAAAVYGDGDGGGKRVGGVGAVTIPRLVLVGGQSTGKSSLVECLAGVSLPRSQGTCTRGPLDIVITSTDETAAEGNVWSASVSLVLPPSRTGSPPSKRVMTGGVVQFGDALTDPFLVADRLRRATLAVRDLANLPAASKPSSISATSLPIINNSAYQTMTADELDDAEDGPNSLLPTFFTTGARLSLSIRAPGAEPLRFTDLPGLISQGTSTEINAIKNMIIRDISQDNVIIVLVASFAMDIRHQNALTLVKRFDPTGSRTVGVLTMPDRLPVGAERQWAKLINQSSPPHFDDGTGSKGDHYLKHGWHVVRCPAQNETLQSISEIEDRFFHQENANDVSTPWRKTAAMLGAVGQDGNQDFVQTRCGLDSLYQHLSELLLEQIRAALPNTIAACTKLSDDLTAEYMVAVAEDKAGSDSFDSNFGRSFRPPFQQQPLKEVSASFETDTFAQRPEAGVNDFDTLTQLLKVLDTIIKSLSISDVAVSKELVPHLKQELSSLAPIFLPFTASEAADGALVAVYKPCAWSFVDFLDRTIPIPSVTKTTFGDNSDDHQSRPNSAGEEIHEAPNDMSQPPLTSTGTTHPTFLVRQSSLSKKPTTITDLIGLLRSDPTLNRSIVLSTHLSQIHRELQTTFHAFIRTYSTFCRTRLTSLIQRSIPPDVREKYGQLCSDVLFLAGEYLTARLSTEMRLLANRVLSHPLVGHGGAGGDTDEDEATHGGAAVVGAGSEYARWREEELHNFAAIRLNLMAKERMEVMGDRSFGADLIKTVEVLRRHGMVMVNDTGGEGGGTRMSAISVLGAQSSGGRGRSGASDLVEDANKTPARRRNQGGAASPSAAASPSRSGGKTPPPPPPPLEPGKAALSPSTDTPPLTPTRRRTTPTPVIRPATLTTSTSPGSTTRSIAQLPFKPQLALLYPLLSLTKPWLYTALQLMAELRADYNFFSLFVACEAQRIPVSLVQDLHAHLVATVSTTIRSQFGEKQLYERYFHEADRPRRERCEWMQDLERRIEGLNGVIQEERELYELLERVEAVNGGWMKDVRGSTEEEIQRGFDEQSAGLVTPQRGKRTTTAMVDLAKVSPRTPRTSNFPISSPSSTTTTSSLILSKKRPSAPGGATPRPQYRVRTEISSSSSPPSRGSSQFRSEQNDKIHPHKRDNHHPSLGSTSHASDCSSPAASEPEWRKEVVVRSTNMGSGADSEPYWIGSSDSERS
ncbi:uncharacterized protein UTRI_04650_B [Ustilago trichophora]|uniref:Dynamin GTPase domain-containing protein n=1 Tax=Ustilago trichophora TaxID=86804 RepID=A0A5C3EC66_9BASI|nr:uncharacterized protein UTRI_04650_B [Ustilago trichophora]